MKSPKSLKEIENALALLAFPDARNSPLASLLQQSNRQRIASNLNRAILIADCKEPNSRLVKLFKLLKWSQEQLQKSEVWAQSTPCTSREYWRGPGRHQRESDWALSGQVSFPMVEDMTAGE